MSKSTALSELTEDVINFPTWLEQLVNYHQHESEFTNSWDLHTQEWSSYTFELNQMIGETLQKANIQKMGHLHCEALDEILLNESKRLTGSNIHVLLLKKLCQLITRNLFMAVEQKLACSRPVLSLSGKVWPEAITAWTTRLRGEGQPPPTTVAGVADSVFPCRADLLAVEAREATVVLLAKHPKLCRKLAVRLCNSALQGAHFRHQIWKIILRNKRVRKLYISLLRTDVEKTRSIRDEVILRQCQDYIEQDNSAYPMRGSVGCLYALKTMLSFFHLISNTTENLSSHIFRIAGTLVLSMNDYLPRSQPPNLEEVLTLVELLFTLMSQLPPYVTKQPPTWFRRYCPSVAHAVAEIHDSKGEPQSQAKFGVCVLQQLRRLDEQVASKILNMLSIDQGMDRPLDPELQDDTCGILVYEMVIPILQPLFAGFLQPDALLFVWDQIMFCMVGSAPIAHSIEYLLSAMLAILIYLAWIRHPQANTETSNLEQPRTPENNEENEANSTTSETEHSKCEAGYSNSTQETTILNTLRHVGKQIKIEDIRFMFKNYFFSGFYCLLSDTESTGDEIGDISSLSQQAHWKQWFSMIDEPMKSVFESRQNQRILRFSELEKLTKLQNTLNETEKTCEDLRTQLRLVQENYDLLNDQLRQTKLREQQITGENRAWGTVVENMEKKLIRMNEELDFYVTRARNVKLSQFELSPTKASQLENLSTLEKGDQVKATEEPVQNNKKT